MKAAEIRLYVKRHWNRGARLFRIAEALDISPTYLTLIMQGKRVGPTWLDKKLVQVMEHRPWEHTHGNAT